MALSRFAEAQAQIQEAIREFLRASGWDEAVSEVVIEPPTERGRGDLTTSFALKYAKATGVPPRRLAEQCISRWRRPPAVAAVEVAGPGFINFTLDTRWLAEVVNQVRVAAKSYGNSGEGQGARVLIEFVSANPTGPLVVVSGRAAAVGDSLARILTAAGFRVDREFYVNDAGNQIRLLGQALRLRLLEKLGRGVGGPWPEGVYPGEYVKDIAARYLAENPEVDEQALSHADDFALGSYAAETLRQEQEKVLARFGVVFDQWLSERSLREAGLPEQVIARLAQRGYLLQRDGAQYFLSSQFGDDKDRVMVKSDGTYTYFVPDAAYHAGKFDRGYDYVIDLLGPDHHGYVGRLKAVVQALGYPPERLEILIIQLVRLVRDGELVRMSKRGGSFVTLEDLMDEAGVDATRYFFLERAPETPMDFDLGLAQLRSSDNPVYYIQYAGARVKSLLRQWQASGQSTVPLDLDYLTAPLERDLLVHLARFPDVVARSAQERAPQWIPRYLTELAGAFHAFYRHHRILEEIPPVRQARLALAEAVLVVITRGLDLLGISQPEQM